MKDYFEEGRFFENHTLHQNHEIMKGSQQTSRSNQEYFSNRDELIGEVGKYCTNPENYDTSKYGYVMRLVYNL